MSVSEAIHGLRQRVDVLEKRIAWYRTRLRNLRRRFERCDNERQAMLDVVAKIHETRSGGYLVRDLLDLLDELEKAAGLR